MSPPVWSTLTLVCHEGGAAGQGEGGPDLGCGQILGHLDITAGGQTLRQPTGSGRPPIMITVPADGPSTWSPHISNICSAPYQTRPEQIPCLVGRNPGLSAAHPGAQKHSWLRPVAPDGCVRASRSAGMVPPRSRTEVGMELLTISAVGIAVVAALRGTWSPCGVSMLSSITPLSESGRGNRYWATVTWFLFGAIIGGATLGALAALGALVVSATEMTSTASAVLVLVAGLITVASDLGVGGFRLPANPRQVERTWLDRYRSWVYGLGFGWQLGVGVATYVMSAGVYLMVIAASATGEPLLAMAIITLFGFLRGLAILPAARVRTPADLTALHRLIERFRPTSRAVAVVAQIGVLASAATVLGGVAAGAVVAAVFLTVTWMLNDGLEDPAPRQRKQPTQPATGLHPLSSRPG